MRTWLQSLFIGSLIAGCTVQMKDTEDPYEEAGVDDTPCETTLTMHFPDGTRSSLDFCSRYNLEAKYEFDPDDPPEVRAPRMTFHATTELDFECYIEVYEPGVCGEGLYRIGDSTGSVVVNTSDCSGAPDDYEGTFEVIG